MKNSKTLFAIASCICFSNFCSVSAETFGEKVDNLYDRAADKTKATYYEAKVKAKAP